MKYSKEEMQEKFIQKYIYDNMYKDFEDEIENLESLVDIADIIEIHFHLLESCSSNKSIRDLADSCYRADKSLLTLFFQAQTLPENEGKELIINSILTQTQKLLALGFSVLGIDRIDEWKESVGLDRSKLDPWKAMIEFKNTDKAVEYFKLEDIEQLTNMGSWELLENGHVLFMY